MLRPIAYVSKGIDYVLKCMQVKEELGPLDPYFIKLSEAMVTWIAAWDQLNPKKLPEQHSSADVTTPAKAAQNGPAKAPVTLSNGAAKA